MTDSTAPKMSFGRLTRIQGRNVLFADMIGNAVELPILARIEKLDTLYPGPTAYAKDFIEKIVVKPLFKPINHVLDYTKNIEGEEDYDKRVNKTKDEQVQSLTDAIFHYGVAGTVGWGAMWAAEHTLNKSTDTPLGKTSKYMYLTDVTVHLGLVGLMSTPMMKEPAKLLTNCLSSVFKSTGIDDEKSKSMAKFAVAVQLPNYATTVADTALLYLLNKKAAGKEAASLLH